MAAFSWTGSRFRVFLGMGGPPLEVVAYSSRRLVPFQLKQNTLVERPSYRGSLRSRTYNGRIFGIAADVRPFDDAAEPRHQPLPRRPRRQVCEVRPRGRKAHIRVPSEATSY